MEDWSSLPDVYNYFERYHGAFTLYITPGWTRLVRQWTRTHKRIHLHARRTYAQHTRKSYRALRCPCVRKEESDRFDLDASSLFSFSPDGGYPLPCPLLSLFFPRTARQDHQSTSRGLLRGYATRSPPRRSLGVPGEVSPRTKVSFLLPPYFFSCQLFPRFFRFIEVRLRATIA